MTDSDFMIKLDDLFDHDENDCDMCPPKLKRLCHRHLSEKNTALCWLIREAKIELEKEEFLDPRYRSRKGER